MKTSLDGRVDAVLDPFAEPKEGRLVKGKQIVEGIKRRDRPSPLERLNNAHTKRTTESLQRASQQLRDC